MRAMSSKDVGVRIRVEKELRDAFQEACLAEGRIASDLLREFMRMFAEQHAGGWQRSLFAPSSKKERETRTRLGERKLQSKSTRHDTEP